MVISQPVTSIPAPMRAIQLRAYDGNPESIAVVELPVPRPGPGQVLVRVAASPINPSDLMFIRGLYGFKKPLLRLKGSQAAVLFHTCSKAPISLTTRAQEG